MEPNLILITRWMGFFTSSNVD